MPVSMKVSFAKKMKWEFFNAVRLKVRGKAVLPFDI